MLRENVPRLTMRDIPRNLKDLATLTIKLGKQDNVLTALTDIEAGNYISDGELLAVPENVPRGFKIAITTIKRGTKINKYNYPIGIASRDIEAGGVVHIHNLTSMTKDRSRAIY